MTVMHIIIGGGPPSPLGVRSLTSWQRMKVSRSGEGGWPGRGWGEEPCVLLRVGIRPSRAFFTLIGTTPELLTKSITSGAVSTQCGRARRNQWEQAGGSGCLWERRTTDFTEDRNKGGGGGGDKGKIFFCFCLGERACCRSSKGSSFSARVSFSSFSPPLLSVC